MYLFSRTPKGPRCQRPQIPKARAPRAVPARGRGFPKGNRQASMVETDGAPAFARVRLYVQADLAEGSVVGLSAQQAHYLAHVLRRKKGDAVMLFNGRDGEWSARIEGVGRGWCSAAVAERYRPQAADTDLWLVFAPIKRARLDFLAEKATELGVSALWPVFTAHTMVSRVNVERLQANAIEAAEQSERLSVPQVFAPASLEEVLSQWPRERRLLVLDETGAADPIATVLGRKQDGAKGRAQDGTQDGVEPWAVLTGPEGGFSGSELDALRQLPFVTTATLGPRVLRADTAALAALACWQALLGDWRTAKRMRPGEVLQKS
jgi:16S rRNA (uracil1498-N3)-methyltransferase